jgi:hypothetical protein
MEFFLLLSLYCAKLDILLQPMTLWVVPWESRSESLLYLTTLGWCRIWIWKNGIIGGLRESEYGIQVDSIIILKVFFVPLWNSFWCSGKISSMTEDVLLLFQSALQFLNYLQITAWLPSDREAWTWWNAAGTTCSNEELRRRWLCTKTTLKRPSPKWTRILTTLSIL